MDYLCSLQDICQLFNKLLQKLKIGNEDPSYERSFYILDSLVCILWFHGLVDHTQRLLSQAEVKSCIIYAEVEDNQLESNEDSLMVELFHVLFNVMK